MGVSMQIFIAKPEEAGEIISSSEEIGQEAGATKEFASGDCFKSIFDIDLNNLEQILDDGENARVRSIWDGGNSIYQYLLGSEQDEAFVQMIPQSLRNKLADLVLGERFYTIARLWANTADRRKSGWDVGVTTESLLVLTLLAWRARAEGKDLLAFVSV